MTKFPQRSAGKAIILVTVLSLALVLITLLPIASAAPVNINDGITDAPENGEAEYSHRLIVQLESPALVEYSAARGIAMTTSGRLDVADVAAQTYIAQLQAEQATFVTQMSQALPSASVATYINESGQSIQATYQAVYNGVAVDPGDLDLETARKALAALPGVKAVHLDFKHDPETYASLPLINAPGLWNNPSVGGQANAGAGIKFASVDSGIHHEAAMFDGTGWSYPDDWPIGGKGDSANNNGKIIASRAYFRPYDPPAVGDENTWPGENGSSHGTHTASTAVGNTVVADYLGITETVSGVAPGAWAMSYRVFYAGVSGSGSAWDVEIIAALEDVVLDGADVVNNSWGGGPTSVGGEFDPLDTTLINVAEAGVFVSMSAGNAGPGNGTTDHPSPDYINVAASTTDGTYAAGRFSVIAPEPVSPTLENMSFAAASFGPALPIGVVITDTYITAQSVDPSNVTGCSAWTGTPFAGNTAAISRGGCFFGNKVYHAQEAGAEFVVIYNNDGDGLVNMGWGCDYAPGCSENDITISSIFIGQTDGENMVAWYGTHGSSAVIEMDTLAFQAGNTPDEIASFSSRGPGVGNVLKPDIAAPGVNILAQGYGVGVTGEARHLGFGQASGTSMASPHVAGTAAIMRQIHPDWSNAAIKSALMSTAKYMDIYNADGSPAQPLDMGAGRLDLTDAADPGVIFSPASLSFGAVITGSSASIQVDVTSVADSEQTYDFSTLYTGAGFGISDTTTLPGFSVDPSSITLAPGATGNFTVTFDSDTSQGIGDNQGYILLESDDYHSHMAAWARVEPDPAGSAEVLVIDNDFSFLLGFPDYRDYYTEALDELGLTYDVWHADAYFANPTSIPDAAYLSQYKVIVYYTGDNYQPDGTFTVSTPLTSLDMNILTEYANGGGIVIAMGQDMSWVMDDSFFDDFVLGGERLEDSITGFFLPNLPIVPVNGAPEALQGVSLDLSGPGVRRVPLEGTNEVPPFATTMSGLGTYSYDIVNAVLDYQVDISVTEPTTITASHIHTGTVGVNGPVAIPISPDGVPVLVTDTFSFDGSLVLDAAQESALLSGGYYINVHTAAVPSGEIRGQVLPAINSDGAANQYFIDELSPEPPDADPVPSRDNGYRPLLTYPGANNVAEGVVAMAHRSQPTLEVPGVNYLGRSIYTGFGLEGVNDGLGSTSRAELLGAFLDWAMDEPEVSITDITGDYDDTSQAYVFEADLESNIDGVTGATYRWDFGDGSPFSGSFDNNSASHDYLYCDTYTVRVEATDTWGNRTIGSLEVEVSQNCMYRLFFPVIIQD